MASAPERGVAPNPAPPTIAKVRLRFAKRGRLRFASHRDVARAFERAVRRAGVPVSHSHGFSPHPRLSWVGAVPTGAASEAEYLEIGLTRSMAPSELAAALDAALPDGVDILEAVAFPLGAPALADLIDATRWRLELPGVSRDELGAAVSAFLATESLVVQRLTKNGRKPVDVRAVVCQAEVTERSRDLQPGVDGADPHLPDLPCAILTTVVRQSTPAVRPDDVLAALQAVADLRPPVPPMATRLAQGLLDDRGRLADPFGADRVTTSTEPTDPVRGAHQR
ncbi:MAG: TIGR03936 family radical SAM-associated protein [Actinomycetota bacterium]|nr:TIGR03936 family radical SAM-associated protein [Actinomycetota bacterium]